MSGYKIKGRDNNYYDIFHDDYFAAGSTAFTINNYKIEIEDNNYGNKILNNKLTTTTTAKYKATTNSKFKNGVNDIFGTSNLVAKYEIYTESKLFISFVVSFPRITVKDDSVEVNKMYNGILIVAIGGGGGGERGTSDQSGSTGGTGQTVAKYIDISSYPDIKIQIVIGSGGAGGINNSGANGVNGNQTTVTIKSGSLEVESVIASGGVGASGFTPGTSNVGANGFQDLDYIVDGNPGRRGAGGGGGGRYNGGFYESGRNGKYGKNGVVYIYYFHK